MRGCCHTGQAASNKVCMYTWFDRDLGFSGRVLVDEEGGRVSQRLVQVKRPIYRVPSLAIHLNRYVVSG